MVKVVSLFLVLIAVLAMFGKLSLLKHISPIKRRKVNDAKKCPKCGTYKIGSARCRCTTENKKN